MNILKKMMLFTEEEPTGPMPLTLTAETARFNSKIN